MLRNRLKNVTMNDLIEEEDTNEEMALQTDERLENIRSKFSFPFVPYTVQADFMESLESTLRDGRCGIFESPTGTGKSLSLICGALTWLRQHKAERKRELEEKLVAVEKTEESDFDWFTEQSNAHEKRDELNCAKIDLDAMKKVEERFVELKKRAKRKCDKQDKELRDLMRSAKQFKQTNAKDKESDSDDLIEDEFDSDNEEEEEVEDSGHVTKIFYCSRTHSQLAQFVRELQRSSFGADCRVVTLGSRQNLCINETVNKLKSLSLINDRCTQLNKNKTSCCFKKRHRLQELRDAILTTVMDIEQIGDAGKDMQACPYYAARISIPEAEVVVMPYNLLLHKGTREACGIKLEGNVVIVDEAHNLLETIGNIHSAVLQKSTLIQARSQLQQYHCKYKTRLSASNLMHVKQILNVMDGFAKCFFGCDSGDQSKVINLIAFLEMGQIDHINLFDVLSYCQRSKISRKLHGFANKGQVGLTRSNQNGSAISNLVVQLQEQNSSISQEQAESTISSSCFASVQEFIKALTNHSLDGRVLIAGDSYLKYLLLSPDKHFAEIALQSRSVILAGGTMHPVEEFSQALFKNAGVLESDIQLFSCGHVIPKEHLLPVVLDVGPGGMGLDFTYNSRSDPKLMDELGRLMVNICAIVPGGIVVFFPSYQMEKLIIAHWEKSGVLLRIGGRKRVFREPKLTSKVDQVLQEYSDHIRNKSKKPGNPQTGAILFSIVGGKMSEGINFSDDLGRCVVLVGLPYPNVQSAELKEHMSYRDRVRGQSSGKDYCDNLCMRAVNQSIGRAIRHSRDYAAVLMLDARYSKSWVQKALPKWIQERLQVHGKFGSAFAAVKSFFKDMQSV